MLTHQHTKPKKNLAARAGHWSATHRKTAIFGWLAFVLIALVAGLSVGTKQIDNNSGPGETGRAAQDLNRAFPQDEAEEKVFIQSKDGSTAKDPEYRSAIQDVTARLKQTEHVRDVRSPLDRGNAGQIAPDGQSVLVTFDVKGEETELKTNVLTSLETTKELQKSHPQFRVEQFGDASLSEALAKSSEADMKRAETLSLPITLLILVVAFGAIVAAGIPVLLALSAVGATMGLVGLVSHITPVSSSIGSVLLLIGLAVGVDYSMFYMRREREERAKGRSPREALDIAAATSGRAVLISGVTVMIAMAGMYFSGVDMFVSFGTGTILVVAVAMIGSLTVLPALLSVLGDRVEKGRVPGLHRLRSRNGESRVWSALIDRVMRRPKLAAALSVGLLVAMAVPALGMNTSLGGVDQTPRNVPIMQTYDRIQAAFPGEPSPAAIVVAAEDVTAPAVTKAITELSERSVDAGIANGPGDVTVSADKSVAILSLPIIGTGTDSESQRAVTELRENLVPATTGQVDGVETNVTGESAGTSDFNDAMIGGLPLVVGFVLTFAFALLLVTFRSIVIPIKAIVLNLLSVGAAFGVMTAVFQNEWAESLLGFQSTGYIESWLPLFMFVILFGLSMDYHVFILSRIREGVDRGMNTADAVSHGIKSTAGVVTAAAIVMVSVFAIFATLSELAMKQMGVGLAVAILIDATIVRGVLLPASMKLLGKYNWYLPSKLNWVPKFEHEGSIPEGARA
jgi:RND superfamily putative drug exporter